MARTRSVDFLPEIFQTPVNRQFLSATLDQLVQEPNFKKIQGFVGRTVGPGINPNDNYIQETTDARANYQLEPGIIVKKPDSTDIADAITYPGITDALALQGSLTTRSDRLYTSEYYTWDPFVDYDKFVNYSQYYWLPNGPDSVDVFSETVPSTDNFVVTRANGVYTFSGANGTNPTLTLVRQGNYTFTVAQNSKEDVNYRVTNAGNSAYIIDYINNPTLTLVRGNTYAFDLSLRGAYRFYIKTAPVLGQGQIYDSGVTNNGAFEQTVTFVVPQDAPDTLYYTSDTEMNMNGVLNIVDGTAGTGSGFFIQTAPGVSGRLPTSPNISSRDVLGVTNNGEDLGIVQFNVPASTAQNFYYGLPVIAGGVVNLVASTLQFNQINNVYVAPFLEEYGSIDGITEFNGKTIIFLDPTTDPEDGGWQITTQFDPLPSTATPGLPGTYDTTLFDQVTNIDSQSERYSVWQIRYVYDAGGLPYMVLNSVEPVNNLEKFSINYGTQYSTTQWYKNAEGYFEQIPLLSAIQNTLYYQDGTDPEIFGRLRLIDQTDSDILDIDEIIGAKNYTSPNGVVFSNGLKIRFIGAVTPSSYQNQEYYVEGVGTGLGIESRVGFIDGRAYFGSYHVHLGQKMTGAAHVDTFHLFIYDSVEQSLLNAGSGGPAGSAIGNIASTYLESGIVLLPVGNFVTPEMYVQSITDFSSLDIPLVPDYLTINRASPDLNPWTRSNRWFHIDIINASSTYNNTNPVVDNAFRGRRPILEYRAGTRLYDYGTQGKQPIDIIDFSSTDALSNINGSIGYSTDGYTFVTGTRVIFAADTNPAVRNKIYEVTFIVPDTVPPLIAQPIINLVPAADADVLIDQVVVCLVGDTVQGKSFWYDGVEWISAQQKISVNQAPLFNVYDLNGISLSNKDKYPSGTFVGSKLFSYATASGTVDPVLGFALKYLSLNNIGDIVFDNNLYTDTFVYVIDNVSSVENISEGIVRQYSNRISFIKEIGWQPAVEKSKIRQQFRFSYDGGPLRLDVRTNDNTSVPAIQVYAGSVFVNPSRYTVTRTATVTTITLLDTYVPGDIIEVAAFSDQTSSVGFYQVPINLENNPLNENSSMFTLGTIRAHYETIGENLLDISGPINGANNTRDLGNIIPYGMNILQQSSPMTLSGYFMRSKEYNIFAALDFNSREYIKFKNQLLDNVIRNDYSDQTVAGILTSAFSDLNDGKSNLNSFYWSDMLPVGSTNTQTVTTYTLISTPVFDLTTTYDFTASNYQGLLVYVNDVLLSLNYDYTVATDGPRLTIIIPLVAGDVITIQEYAATYGNYVPNTPTKLGLYPAYKPEIFVDDTYVNPTTVIRGHDGSITVAFSDIRDQILLEFETRIFNNLKIRSAIPLPVTEVMPGQFRTTDYSLTEINEILATDFLSWIGWNKLNYSTQNYIATNEFTWNYSAAGNRLTGDTSLGETPLLGAWRGIYNYFYDTDSPQRTPWQMLGFSQIPSWWIDVYGPAPYTQDNLVLWDDLALGLVADPAGEYILPQYARPRLTDVIPTGTEGQLLSPFDSVVGMYDSSQFRKSWVFGDGGPVEASWSKSSSYPFAIMRLLALTRPAEFFGLFADRDLYKYDSDYNQYLYNNRYRLDANGIQVYGSGISKASYIDWIVDYNQVSGRDSSAKLAVDLASLDVRLCYRMGTFTDKQYLKIYTEKSSPNSQNSSLLLPDESYDLLLYKNQPFERIIYSAVIIQNAGDGYRVLGYSITNPYFEILTSRPGGLKTTISTGGESVTVPTQYSDVVTQVPYGYVLANATMVVDFLLSYGALLSKQGLLFDGVENGRKLNWNQMAQEFLYWANQGWSDGSIIGLNPAAGSLTAIKSQAIVDSIVLMTQENLVLDQNRTTIPARDLIVIRDENTFTVSTASAQTISYLDLKFVSYENMVVLDNVSIFNDLIYAPVTGARQGRINVVATVSAEWNGQLDAQGFILNDDTTVTEWQPIRKYAKGEIVSYKNNYWSAQGIVQPGATFRFSEWVKSDYTKIQRGLLANIPNKANQLANSYNVNAANLELDNDLLSYGLIGFKPRTYMTSLNLDDVSQVNVYQQFLKSKGTKLSVDLFANAQLSKEVAEYDVSENWAIQRAVYGANANQSFVEFRLNEALLRSDPSLVQLINPGESTLADQPVLLNEVWRESYKLTSPDFLPTTFTVPTDTALPSAGYVNIDDVDITVFSIQGQLGLAPGVINTIGVGTTVWAAKSNEYDWNIYRCVAVPGFINEISNNLNGTSTVVFTKDPLLAVNDIIILKFVDSTANGVYRVLAVPAIESVIIDLQADITITGQGLAYFLQTQRVAQASDVVNLPYSTDLLPGARAWVDDNGFGHWEVLEKQQPFNTRTALQPDDLPTGAKFGSAVAQSVNNTAALVGMSGYNNTGAIYTYLTDDQGNYAENTLLALGATDTKGYGNAVDTGTNAWSIAGASASNNNQGYAAVIYRNPASNVFEQLQLLTAPDQNFGPTEFGYAVAMSLNERWMYISAPGANTVYAYGRVDVDDNQTVTYTSTGFTSFYKYSDTIEISNDEQLSVVVNNTLQILNVDYSVNNTDVIFNSAPVANLRIIIRRRSSYQLDQGSYYNILQNSTSGVGSGAEFTVDRTRGVYSVSVTAGGTNYAVANTITILAATVDGGASPANDITLTVTSIGAGGSLTGFTKSGSGVSNTTIFPIDPYLYTATNIYSFTVTVDGVLQRPHQDYDFNSDSALYAMEIVFVTVPAAGTTIIVSARNYFEGIESISIAGLPANARFGSSLSTTTDGRQVIIGCSNDTVDATTSAGSTYAIDRSVTRYIIDNPSQLTYAMPAAFVNPVAVILNSQFLTNDAQIMNGQFAVDGFDIVLSDSVTLAVGDILEIESNIFTLIQKIPANVPAAGALFGAATDVCDRNCSIYVGAPGDSSILSGAGSVERHINQARLFGVITSTIANPVLDNGDTIRINNTAVAVPNSPNQTVAGLAAAINAASIPNVIASVSAGLLTISVINNKAADEFNKLSVLPGTVGTAFADLGFKEYTYAQTLISPRVDYFAGFGSAVFIDSSAVNLVVGAPGGNVYTPLTFDQGTTYFDDNSTSFFSVIVQSGAVYTFDYLPSATPSITNPGSLVFGQQIYDSELKELDQWGSSLNYTSGRLLVGSPGYDNIDDSTANYGRVGIFDNTTETPAWTVIHTQQPVVDVQLLDSVYMYDRLLSAKTQYFDFFNPLQGKILGAARQNIDFLGAVDPAKYNTGPVNNNGNYWAQDRVGQIWWDTNSARFIDPNQDDIVYASRRWGQLFPGSRIEIYQWVASSTPPSQYAGLGTPLSTTRYTVLSRLGSNGIIATNYYFWVTGIDTINSAAGKTLSTVGIASYIENPKSSGIPYIAALDASTIAIYNGLEFISAQDTILHIEYDKELNSDNIHVEYELVTDGQPDSFISAGLYRKLQDSFCGVNTNGAKVPDPNLSDAEKIGVQFRPRQTMFANRYMALQNYLTRVNAIIKQYPMTESRTFTLLNSSEPEPNSASGAWNKRLANLEELSYQNLKIVPVGYNYLIVSDSSNNGLWAIYTVIISNAATQEKSTQLLRVQTYDTRDYWNYIDWYLPGYNSSIKPVAQVATYTALDTISVPVGSSVKVTSNAQGKFEIYLRTLLGWDRVGLEDGTIAFSAELWNYSIGRFGFDIEVFDAQYFDKEPVIETRKIIQAINQELLIDDLAIERNRVLILMFNYILSESTAPEWLVKTSLIDVEHRIRDLIPFQLYSRDNQEFVVDYIQEVKPYHVQIRELHLAYNGQDAYPGDLADFDNPAFYNVDLEIPQYISPVLLPYTASTAVGTGTNNFNSDTAADSTIWTKWPWTNWYNNYLLSIQDVNIVDGGSGYTEPPIVIVTGTCIVPASMTAVINSSGLVVGVIINDAGSGYSTTAMITFDGGNGTGASAVVVMGNDLIRSISTTIKYDRYQYVSTIVEWEPNAQYINSTEVRYANQVWAANFPLVIYQNGPSAIYALDPVGGGINIEIGTTYARVNSTVALGYTPYERFIDGATIITGDDNTPGPFVVGNTFTISATSPGSPNLSTLITATLLGTTPAAFVAAVTAASVPYASANINSAGAIVFTHSTGGIISLGLGIGTPVATAGFNVNVKGALALGATLNLSGFYANTNAQITFSSPTFNTDQWLLVDPETLSGVDRTMGLYTPTVNQPGLSLPLLIDGVEYPGLQVKGVNYDQNSGFDVGNYDINTFDNLSYGPEGKPTYDPAILDAIYESSFVDPYLGIRATDVIIAGGEYIDVFSSYAPEELVPGSEFDTLDMRVYTTPGADWERDGHGFNEDEFRFAYDTVANTASFADNIQYPVQVLVSNQTRSTDMYLGTDYTVNWPDQIITIINGASDGEVIAVNVYGIGGGNQLYRNAYNGATIGNTVIVPVMYTAIQELAVFVNGVYTTDYTLTDLTNSRTKVLFGTTYTATDYINLTAIGVTTIDSSTVAYSWSTPQTQYINGVTGILTYTLTNAMIFTNPDNLVVTVDSIRARSAAGAEYYGDGSTAYALPERLGMSPGLIADNQVRVYLNDVLQTQGVVYTVEAYDPLSGSPRAIQFITSPTIGARVLVTVSTDAQYIVTGNQLIFNTTTGLIPNDNDIISVTSWNDTRQQDVLTQVFVGPVTESVVYQEGYDDTVYSPDTVDGDPGSFDYADAAIITVNNFILQREIADTSRLWVTLNGNRLFYGVDFTMSGQELVLTSGVINAIDVMMITLFTNSVAPGAMAFRIFQDMRGVQATYRITTDTTTTLTATLGATDDVMYVTNSTALAEPDLAINIWGVLTVDGERIMYRTRDTITNTVSGLRRGTAGTGAATHAVDAIVYDLGRGNLLAEQFQNYIDYNEFMADGVTTLFTADNVVLAGDDSTLINEAVEVYVGGILLAELTGYTIIGNTPVTVEFDTAPADGVQITVLIRQGVTWYAPGINTASDGVALQNTDTQAARFLRGL